MSQGIRTVLVHVDGIWPGRLGLWVRIDFAGTESADVVYARPTVAGGPCEAELLVFLCLCLVDELLVAVETLDCGAADDGGYCAPLGGHELG